jgi:hypothetical protein
MKAYLAIAYAIPTLIVVLSFARYANHSWFSVTQWALFYLVTVVQPLYFASRALKQFDAHGIAANSRLRSIAFYPVIVGGLALLIGLELIRVS